MDAAAFADLYLTYADRIRHYCYTRTRCNDTADDLTQDTFTRAWSALLRGYGPKAHVKAWLYQIARNLIIDFYRRQGKAFVGSFEAMADSIGRQETESHWRLFGGLDADHWLIDPYDMEVEVVERIDVAERLAGIQHVLTAKQAAVIQMRYGEGYAYEEIAVALDMNSGAVKQLRNRGIEAMRLRMAA